MTKLSIGSTANPLTGSRVPFALLIVVLMAFGLYAIFVTGPAMRAVAQANLDRALADENRAFCEKFGMRVGTSEFVACSQELTVIRTKQTDRDNEANML
jgi:hypothetical protein